MRRTAQRILFCAAGSICVSGMFLAGMAKHVYSYEPGKYECRTDGGRCDAIVGKDSNGETMVRPGRCTNEIVHPKSELMGELPCGCTSNDIIYPATGGSCTIILNGCPD